MAEQEKVKPQWVVEAIKAKGARRRVAYTKREKEALRLKEEVRPLCNLIRGIIDITVQG
jgi:hypothetical protein